MDMIPKSMAREFNDALTDGLRKAVEDGDVSEQRALECREWLQRGEFLGDYLDALTDATGAACGGYCQRCHSDGDVHAATK